MTLLEVIIVIALIGTVYALAMPSFNAVTGTETATKLGQLATDIRSAYDMAVLKNKTFRLVFEFDTNKYWLEEADQRVVKMGDKQLHHDPTEEEEKLEKEEFKSNFETYKEASEIEFRDPDSDKVYKIDSPVLKAKSQLAPATWEKIENLEWRERDIGPQLMIQDFFAEHHEQKQTRDLVPANGRAMLYFFPNGSMEKAVIHIAFRGDGNAVDSKQEPYTLTTHPYEGQADIVQGYVEHAFDSEIF